MSVTSDGGVHAGRSGGCVVVGHAVFVGVAYGPVAEVAEHLSGRSVLLEFHGEGTIDARRCAAVLSAA